MQQFQKLKNFMKSKDRKHPSAFVVFTADKSDTVVFKADNSDKKIAQDAVTKATQGLYELFLQQTNVSSSISYYLQNKVCDLYLICEHCNQTQGTSSSSLLSSSSAASLHSNIFLSLSLLLLLLLSLLLLLLSYN